MDDLQRETAWTSLLMVVDIVGFSKHDQHVQLAMVRHLVRALDDIEVLRGRNRSSGLLLNSTGDGFLLGLSTNGPYDLPKAFCEAAIQLVRHARSFRDPSDESVRLELRIGLHMGEFVDHVCQYQETSFAVGVGINWCARVADLAGPNQILVSDRFVELVERRFGGKEVDRFFFPKRDKAPIEVSVKHGRPAKVRMLEGPDLGKDPPPKLRIVDQVDQHLANALEIMGRTVARGIAQQSEVLRPGSPLTLDQLATRLTLWIPEGDQLVPMRLRHQIPPPQVALVRSRTRYLIPNGYDPDGDYWPVVEAYLTERPAMLLDLPDPQGDERSYYEECSRRGLSPDSVSNFTRKSRSILAIPMKVLERPGGVLCVDMVPDLPEFRAVLEAAADALIVRSGYFVAALLQLRQT